MSVESYYRPSDLHFRLPPDAASETFAENIEVTAGNLFYEAIEIALGYDFDVSREAASHRRLAYAGALALTGNYVRSEAHFDQALSEIESDVAFYSGEIEGTLPLVDTVRTRAQALLYSEMAMQLLSVGRFDDAEELITKAEATIRAAAMIVLPETRHIPDISRSAQEPMITLKVARNLAKMGHTKRAEALRSEMPLQEMNYQLHMAVLDEILEQQGDADNEETMTAQLNRFTLNRRMYGYYFNNVKEGTDRSLDLHRLGEFMGDSARRGLLIDPEVDLAECFHDLDYSEAAPAEQRALSYDALAVAYLIAGDTVRAAEAVESAHEQLRIAARDTPTVLVASDAVDKIILRYAQVGNSAQAEEMIDRLAPRFQAGIRALHAEALVDQGAYEQARMVLVAAESDLEARFAVGKEGNIDEYDFSVGQEIAISYARIGDYAAMDRVYRRLQEQDDEDKYYDYLSGENGSDNIPIAKAYLESGNLSRALEALTNAENLNQASFLTDLMKHELTDPDTQDPNYLIRRRVLIEELRKYIDYRKSLWD